MALNSKQAATCKSVSSSAFLGAGLKKKSVNAVLGVSAGQSRVACKLEKVDKWAGLGTDTSDDQQDIARGKGLVDSLFQGAVGDGTQNAIMSSWEYISTGQRT